MRPGETLVWQKMADFFPTDIIQHEFRPSGHHFRYGSMHNSAASGHHFLLRRLALVWALLLTVWALGAWWAIPSAAQNPSQKPPPIEEEDPVKKPTRKLPKEDEEEPVKKPLRPVPREDEDTSSPNDLAGEAERTQHPELRDLYRRLMHPHDVIALVGGRKQTVAPISVYIGPRDSFTGQLVVKPFDDQWKPLKAQTIARREIESVRYYEDYALTQVKAFLDRRTPERLEAAE